MKTRYLIADSILGHLLLNIAKSRNNNKRGALKILIYHDITWQDFDKFEMQIKYIARQYGFIKPDDLDKILTGKMKYAGTKVLLTFDDGFRSNILLEKKVLNPLGIKAIYFIPPGFINAKDRDERRSFIADSIHDTSFSPEEITDDMAPMVWQDIKRLLSEGHTIGAHTVNHRRLTEIISEDELRYEIVESGNILQEKLGIDIDHFSFPFGNIESIDQRAMKIIKGRYKYCHSGIRGNNSIDTNPYIILRDPVSVNDPINYLKLIVEDGLGFMYKKRRLQMESVLE
jgi:peptidoglycan/xylan/chitin deacetylase (PgdA/CDA1 family)